MQRPFCVDSGQAEDKSPKGVLHLPHHRLSTLIPSQAPWNVGGVMVLGTSVTRGIQGTHWWKSALCLTSSQASPRGWSAAFCQTHDAEANTGAPEGPRRQPGNQRLTHASCSSVAPALSSYQKAKDSHLLGPWVGMGGPVFSACISSLLPQAAIFLPFD